MKRTFLTGCLLIGLGGGAIAGGNHAGGHSHGEAGMMAIGRPGDPAQVTRTVKVVMKEKEDGRMVFEPTTIAVREGETLRLQLVNAGELDHEFVMDVQDSINEHKVLMERFPEMEHDDPNAIRLGPGESGEIIWTFANAGEFGFACLIPGHYDAGMKGHIRVRH